MMPALLNPQREKSAPALQGLVDLTLGVGLLERLALVMLFLPRRDRDLKLGDAVLEVQPQRHERVTALRRFAGELADLAAVQQQFARTLRLVVEPIAHL